MIINRVLGRLKRDVFNLLESVRFYLLRMRLFRTSQRLTPSLGTALVVAPHQDDESFGCGGLIALKRQSGTAVKVVFLTDGQKSYGCDRIPSSDLIAKRQQEALQALETLGVDSENVDFFNYPDGELQCLNPLARQTLVTSLTQLLRRFEPEEVYVTYRRDGHSDHEAAALLVREAIAQATISPLLLEYPVWSLYQPTQFKFDLPEFKQLYHVPIQAVRARKQAAIACHRSQYVPIPPDTTGGLPRGFLRRLSSSQEFFFKG